MKALSPKVNLIFSIGALVFAFSLCVFVIFGWFLLSSATSDNVESDVIAENCNVVFKVSGNGQAATNKLELIGAMPGISFDFAAVITNTSGKDGYITINIFYSAPEPDKVDMRNAFVVEYGTVGEPPIPNRIPFSGKTEINMITVSDNVRIGTTDPVTINFAIVMRTGEGDEDMNIYQGQNFKINKLEIKIVTT